MILRRYYKIVPQGPNSSHGSQDTILIMKFAIIGYTSLVLRVGVLLLPFNLNWQQPGWLTNFDVFLYHVIIAAMLLSYFTLCRLWGRLLCRFNFKSEVFEKRMNFSYYFMCGLSCLIVLGQPTTVIRSDGNIIGFRLFLNAYIALVLLSTAITFIILGRRISKALTAFNLNDSKTRTVSRINMLVKRASYLAISGLLLQGTLVSALGGSEEFILCNRVQLGYRALLCGALFLFSYPLRNSVSAANSATNSPPTNSSAVPLTKDPAPISVENENEVKLENEPKLAKTNEEEEITP